MLNSILPARLIRALAGFIIAMWQIKNPEIKPTMLDFSSSGQGLFQANRLLSDGIEIINALELVDWDEDKIQFLVCASCGYTRCKSGDWVSLRKTDSLILILPAFEAIFDEEREKEEYEPPSYLKKQGVAYLDISTYERLRSQHSSFPSAEKIQQLNMREAILVYRWDAPAHVLGEPPDLNVRREIILATSEGDYVEYLKHLESLIQKHYKDESNVTLRSALDTEKAITFFLDAEEFMEWEAMVFDGSTYRLLIDSRYVVAVGDRAS